MATDNAFLLAYTGHLDSSYALVLVEFTLQIQSFYVGQNQDNSGLMLSGSGSVSNMPSAQQYGLLTSGYAGINTTGHMKLADLLWTSGATTGEFWVESLF